MPNNTACSTTSTCTIVDGATTNGTYFVAPFDPNAPAPYWHQYMELATICVCNSLTFVLIVARLCYRWMTFKKFKRDDVWMAIAGFFLIPYTASQIGSNKNGSGLHMVNVTELMREWHWHYAMGWSGYYVVTTCIKLSVCFCFLEILSLSLKPLRICVWGLCAFIASLGITMTITWIFGCTPFLSNFDWNIDSTSCVNFDNFRWLWIGLSVPIDMCIMAVPLQILKRTRLRQHERRILRLIFCATLLGTMTCIVSIYGSYETRSAAGNDMFYNETGFVMMCDIEILMYALGASFPVLSRYIVQRTDPGHTPSHANFTSWARYVPNFFLGEHIQSHLATRPLPSRHGQSNSEHRSENSKQPLNDVDSDTCAEQRSDIEMRTTSYKSRDYQSSNESDMDFDKFNGSVRGHPDIERGRNDGIMNGYLRDSHASV